MKQKEIELLFTLQGRDKIKVITLCTENIKRILLEHELFKDRIRKDTFRDIIEIKFGNKWHKYADVHAVILMNEIATNFAPFQKVNKGMVMDAVDNVAEINKYDSATDYIKSLKWDNVPRLDNWLSTVYGVEADDYHIAVGSNWIKGLVKRIIEPGCKFDYVLVIEGEQGTLKSSSFAALGGDWYIETTMNTDNKDFFMQFAGNVIIEFSEGETLSRTDVKRMKAIITTQVDKFRAPYERVPKDHPRRCVFAMTTNESEYLKDDTGNRRWLPVRMVKPFADVHWISENRDQLFAEAYHRLYSLNENVYEFPHERTMQEQADRMETSPYQERVEDWYFNRISQDRRDKGITVQDIWENVMNSSPAFAKPITRYDSMVIAGILKKIGLEKNRVMVNNIRQMRWFLSEKNRPTTTLKVSNYAEHI